MKWRVFELHPNGTTTSLRFGHKAFTEDECVWLRDAINEKIEREKGEG
jgi:hypothetical protein